MAIPLLDSLDLTDKTLTADALLTQRKLANYALYHKAHYVFTVKDNQPTLREAIRPRFQDRKQPDYQEPLHAGPWSHRTMHALDLYPPQPLSRFPQCRSGLRHGAPRNREEARKTSTETVFGLTSHTPQTADAACLLAYIRGHWAIEHSCHYILDWNWDQDRCTIRTGRSAATKAAGHGPENLTALRRFAIGIIKSRTQENVATTIHNGWHATAAWSSTIFA